MKKTILCCILFIVLLLFQTRNSWCQTMVSGNVSGIWTLAASPYYVTADCTVPTNQTLTLEPGVEVYIGDGLTFNVLGKLLAKGTSDKHIKFTSPNTTVYWNSIMVYYSGLVSEFEYCDLSYAQRGISLHIEGNTNGIMITYIRNCYFSNCKETGIYGYSRGTSTWNSSANPYLNPVIYGCIFNNTFNGCIFKLSGYDGTYGIPDSFGHASPIIINNIFKNLKNIAFNTNILIIAGSSKPVFTNNTLVNCQHGIYTQYPFDILIKNNIFVNNEVGIERTGSLSSTISYNCFFQTDTFFIGYPTSYGQLVTQNNNGDQCDIAFNIFLDPLFNDTISYFLTDPSPCVDAGSAEVFYNDLNFPPSLGGARNDIGAYGGPGGDLPAKPINLNISADSESQLVLSWTDMSNNERGFEIYRSTTSGSGFTLKATAGIDVTSYLDTGLISGTRYYYKIRSSNIIGVSDFTNEVSASTNEVVPASPSNLITTTLSETQIKLKWSDNSINESGFEIHRSTVSGSDFTLLYTSGANVTEYTNSNLNINTIYYFKIRSINEIGYSQFTPEASASTANILPNLPNNITIRNDVPNKLSLSWNDNSLIETGYRIYRSTISNVLGDTLIILPPGSISYTDENLQESTTYYYTISVFNNIGENLSSQVAATTLEDFSPDAENISGCFGTQIPNLSALGSNIKWYADPDRKIILYQGNSYAHGQTEVGHYDYYVTQTINSIESYPKLVSLDIHPLPAVDAGIDFASCDMEFSLLANQPVSGTGIWSITRGTGNFTYENSYSTTFKATTLDPVSVRWTITDANLCAKYDEVNITLKESPKEPNIHLKGGYIFICTDANMYSYQWYKDGQPIEGSTRQFYLATRPVIGNYAVETGFENGCKTMSTYLSKSEYDFSLEETIKLFPVPVRNLLTMEMENELKGKVLIRILGQTGEIVLNKVIFKEIHRQTYHFDLSNFMPGHYVIELIFESDDKVYKNLLKL